MARFVTTVPLSLTNDVRVTGFDDSLTIGITFVEEKSIERTLGSGLIGFERVIIDAEFFGKKFDEDLNGTLEEFNLNFSTFGFSLRSTRSIEISDFKLGLEQSFDLLGSGVDRFVKRIAIGDDEFIGSSGDDIMRSYAGDDLMEGGAGDDFLTVDGGNDTVMGGAGDDLILADTGNDMIFGGAGDDAVFAGAGNDDIDGGDGNDFLALSGGNDTAVGGTGDDSINGQGGDDDIIGGRGADSLSGGGGSDTLNGQSGSDSIKGGGRADMIIGGGGRDTIKAGGGADIVRGNGGRDVIDGGGGADLLIGGGGRDTFAFKNNSGDDIVKDFRPGKDLIDLSLAREIDDFADLLANHVSDVSGDLIIAVSGSSDVTFEGVQIADLAESDFIF